MDLSTFFKRYCDYLTIINNCVIKHNDLHAKHGVVAVVFSFNVELYPF